MTEPSLIPPPGDGAFFKWVISGVAAAGGYLLNRIHGKNEKLEKKIDQVENDTLSKEVFEEFRRGNDSAHEKTHEIQSKQDYKLDRIFERLDGKADKGRL